LRLFTERRSIVRHALRVVATGLCVACSSPGDSPPTADAARPRFWRTYRLTSGDTIVVRTVGSDSTSELILETDFSIGHGDGDANHLFKDVWSVVPTPQGGVVLFESSRSMALFWFYPIHPLDPC
jgi:hypothetical protein